MIHSYLEQKKDLHLSEQNKKNLEGLLQFKETLKKQISDFSSLFSELQNTHLFNKEQIDKIEKAFLHQTQNNILEYNEKRDELFKKLKNNLPIDVIETYQINQKKVIPFVDSIGILANSLDIQFLKLKKYIEENQLVMFPYEFLKENHKNENIQCVVEHAKQVKQGYQSYVVGTLNHLDLSKILNGHEFDMNQCIFSKESENLMMSFMFQLPLLQTMNEEIKMIHKNQYSLNAKMNELQNNLEKFMNNQYKMNQDFTNKINQVIQHVNRLEAESYQAREKIRKNNPTIRVEDTSVHLTEEITKKVDNGSDTFWGEPREVIVGHYIYHPLKTVNKPESIQYHLQHLYINNLSSYQEINLDINLQEAKQIVIEDLKSNFNVVLWKDIQNDQEIGQVLCSFGKGYHPLTKLTFEQDINRNQLHTNKKGMKA